ncbi:MAG: ABC transporter substrate-binding protein, partial [Clostridiales bacterium]|nr:ABC transporter substrate-binding protein [Clostridiales bacterium]
TTSVTKFTWAVPNMSIEPEAAIAFMSMMYTDSRIANLMAWGVEGVDYEVVDGVAKYVEGNEDNAYHSSDYMVGNQFIVLPWDGQSADYRQKQMEDMEASPISKYLGFSVDTNSITNELSAVSVAINEYVPTLECGFGDEALYEAFIDKLYDSGVQKIIDEYQKQLDEWLALEAEQ